MEELLRELGSTMRALRRAAGMSLRQVETATGRGRGLLSQVETGRARPPREVAEWYDAAFGGDGVVVSMLAELRGAHGPRGDGRSPAEYVVAGDAFELLETSPPNGMRVQPGATVSAEWTLRNAGTVAWCGRAVRRVGAPAAARLLTCPPSVALPDAAPGAAVAVRIPVQVPQLAGTFAAYWELSDARGGRCFGRGSLLALVLVADW